MMIYNLTFFTNRVFHHPYLPRPPFSLLVSAGRASISILSSGEGARTCGNIFSASFKAPNLEFWWAMWTSANAPTQAPKLKLLLPHPCYVHDYMLHWHASGISSFVNQQVCFFSGIDNRLCRSRVPTNHNPPPSLLFSGKSLSKHPSERNNAMSIGSVSR